MDALINVFVFVGFVSVLLLDHWQWIRFRRLTDVQIENAAAALEIRILRALHEETEKIDRLAKMRQALGKDN